MKLINILNPAATVLYLCLCATGLFLLIKKKNGKQPSDTPILENDIRSRRKIPFSKLIIVFLIAAVFALGCALRFYHLTELTVGLQQDEASIGYEAYCIANYEIDRNGYHYPVYPVTWGSGGGSPLLIYLNVITAKLLGHGPFSVRVIPALAGCLTIAVFALLLFRLWGAAAALTGTIVLSFAPWHIILSRWSLDSNITPFLELCSIALFTEGLRAEKTVRRNILLYCAAAVSAIAMYSYGSAMVVIPLYLLFTCAVCLAGKELTWRQCLISFLIFMVICLPLAVFYVINFFDLKEISLSWISFPKFTSAHSSAFIDFGGNVPAQLLENLKTLLRTITVGELQEDSMWNFVPGFAALYRFTWPVTLLGIAAVLLRMIVPGSASSSGNPGENTKNSTEAASSEETSGTAAERENTGGSVPKSENRLTDLPMVMAFLAALLFSLVIQPDTNRQVLLFVPLLYMQVMGWRFLLQQHRLLPAAGLCVMTAALVLFCKSYFGGYYMQLAGYNFMPGYGEAIRCAYGLAGQAAENDASIQDLNIKDAAVSQAAGSTEEVTAETAGSDRQPVHIYSTYKNLASPFMIALYYCQYNPYDFLTTVHYKDPNAEFRIADSFGEFTFGLPEEDLSAEIYKNSILVLSNEECVNLDPDSYDLYTFWNYTAAVPHSLR